MSDEQFISAAEAVRSLTRAMKSKDNAQRYLVRECQAGLLNAVAKREIVQTSVSTGHRERFRIEEMQATGRTLLESLYPSEMHCNDKQIDAEFWRNAFDDEGRPVDGWRGKTTENWRLGDFSFTVCRREPVAEWEGDKGDWVEVRLIGVAFEADRVSAAKS